jgi:hypothetical protein
MPHAAAHRNDQETAVGAEASDAIARDHKKFPNGQLKNPPRIWLVGDSVDAEFTEGWSEGWGERTVGITVFRCRFGAAGTGWASASVDPRELTLRRSGRS